jgi:hypothetical protein
LCGFCLWILGRLIDLAAPTGSAGRRWANGPYALADLLEERRFPIKTLASLVFELLLDGTDCVAREAIPEGRFRRKEVAVDQFLECIWYLHVGAVLQGVPEVCAVDLAVPEEGAATGVEDAGGGGDEEGPDLCSYQNSPMPTALCRHPSRVVKERCLRQLLYH